SRRVKPAFAHHYRERRSAPTRRRFGVASLVRRQEPWRAHHGAKTMARPHPTAGSTVTACWPELGGGRSGQRLPELRGVDTVLLHLQVQGLVVGAEEPRRLALVSSRGLEGQADCVPLGVRCGRVGELP